jgi:transposase InsO family protein
MPWKECSQMSSRLEFVLLASAPSANIRQLCRIFGISPKTGYKLLARFHASGEAGLQDLSRRPKSSPGRTSDLVEQAVLELHVKYPYWGARKLQALLPDHVPKPHPNTIAAILRRHGKQVLPVTERSQEARIRFEHAAPNLLWQMDFKGHFPLTDARAGRCHPLTIVDDHSRFAVCLTALDRENRVGVQAALTETFRFYGLPERITCDNGAPWRGQDVGPTKLEAWLLRLGVRVSHSRPYHPQTQGKDERFHRTLKRELLDHRGFDSISRCQHAFDEWRDQYNLIRPHESLGQKPPHHPLPSQRAGVPGTIATGRIRDWRPASRQEARRGQVRKQRHLRRRRPGRRDGRALPDRNRWRLYGAFLQCRTSDRRSKRTGLK